MTVKLDRGNLSSFWQRLKTDTHDVNHLTITVWQGEAKINVPKMPQLPDERRGLYKRYSPFSGGRLKRKFDVGIVQGVKRINKDQQQF